MDLVDLMDVVDRVGRARWGDPRAWVWGSFFCEPG